ncbi:MAG TPA: C4-type zinc ribbon domain-containing protein [Bacteroidales bacterium]|nr:C4-type zinc ribbon domain-containing protein [Bacteroidales bacterium]
MAKTTKKEAAPAKKAPAKKAPAKKPAAKKAAAKEVAPEVAAPKEIVKPAEKEEKVELKVERTLKAIYTLQQIDSQVDRIRIIRGELPLEVQDLEDEIVGLETRIENFKQDVENIEKTISDKKEEIKNSLTLIKRYEEQQMNVRNNREYDSLTKEIEFQSLEMQLAEKRINENKLILEAKSEEIAKSQELLDERRKDLEIKNSELADIVTETEKEEKELVNRSESQRGDIDDRLMTAYQRIRKNARNGLAVVKIERDACGGCFNKIPPQHQLDIMMHKKIIVCEYCGRILVDDNIASLVDAI